MDIKKRYINKTKYLKRDRSKATLAGFTYNKREQTVFPNFSFDAAMSMIDSDPVARGAMNRFVNKCMEGDNAVVLKDTLEYAEDEHLRLQEKYQFRTNILRKIFTMLRIYNNAFIEIVTDSKNNTKSLNVLDSTLIKPITDHNGDPIMYESKIQNPKTGLYPSWTKDEIVWVKFGDRATGFAPVDLKALWTIINLKSYITRYVSWLWKTGQYRVMYNPKQATSQNIEDFLAWLQRHDDNFQMPMFLKGELETKVLRDMKENDSIIQLLEYCDNQILVAFGMPPISVGIPDSSGRSNSDQQDKDLTSMLVDIKKVIEDAISYDLFPKISKSKYLFRFGPSDRLAEKQAWEVIQIMQSVGATPEAMREHLTDRGLYYKTKNLFAPSALDLATGNNPRDKDMAPSRAGKDDGTRSAAIGTGEQATTRQDQMRK